MGFLSRRCSGKGPQLALRGESPGFSRVAVEFLLSYDGDLRDPLVGPQVDPISIRVMEGPSGFLCSSCQGRGPHLDLRPEPQGSSPGRPGSQGFLGRPQGSQGLVSYGAMQDRSPLDLEKQCEFSCLVHHSDRWLSFEAPQGCLTCHRVLYQSSG